MNARPDRKAARARRSKAGFTLVEVLVALSAGVLVSIAAFTLSKNATAFFQHEARISTAQLALTLAMNRLTNDIQRASFLSTPNIRTDPTICGATSGTWPTGLGLLAGVNIAASTQSTPQSTANGLTPDQIILGGSMDSSEVFEVQSVVTGSGGGPLLVLRVPASEPATMRATASLGAGETLDGANGKLNSVFYPRTSPAQTTLASGRFAHIYQPETNTHWFGVISNFALNTTTGAVQVQLATTPTIPTKPQYGCGIGLGDTGGGWLLSVVSRVKYDIRSLSTVTNQYSPVVAPQAAAVTGDSGRTELVRTELNADGTEYTQTMELIAEYAVDMRFGITVTSRIVNDNYNPTVTTYPIGDSNVYAIAGDIASGGTPQRIRSLLVRLATRSRAPDRDADLPVGPDGRRLHFLVGTGLQPAYARVRTSYVTVALPNQGGFWL